MNWDYIIVGAGSAGSVLANRLSADVRNNVLLLEAGGSDNHIRYKIPAMTLNCMGNPKSDWMFTSEPDPTRKGRVDLLSRGKVLGGSSSINGIIYVRGNRGDYDHWARLGNRGWDYDTMLGYFQRLEGNRDASSNVYGTNGPVVVSQLRGAPHFAHVFVQAMDEIGVKRNPSYNGEEQEGAAIAHGTHHLGIRYSAARAYLKPARSRKNLKIISGATVQRILLDGRRAVGIEYELRGAVLRAHAAGEIILSASVFNSPKLLMLSGIGPGEHLQELGIEVLHASPGVGLNLHDHPASNVKAIVNRRTVNLDMNLFGKFKHGLRFVTTLSGHATYLLSAVAFVRSRPELEFPDIQFHFGAYASEINTEGIKMLDVPAIILQPNVSRTRSRGSMKLRSKDPRVSPRINLNLLSDPHDVETLIAGTRIARKLLKTRAFEPYFVREYAPGPGVETDAQWEQYTREAATHVYHACGTCKMGVDPMAVVDPELRVYGIEGLRVVDSSIIPQIPSGNTNAISMAIGEKGADLILNAHR